MRPGGILRRAGVAFAACAYLTGPVLGLGAAPRQAAPAAAAPAAESATALAARLQARYDAIKDFTADFKLSGSNPRGQSQEELTLTLPFTKVSEVAAYRIAVGIKPTQEEREYNRRQGQR